jgi:3-oxoacyl-[acyl-carrier protein] reductase
MIDKIVAIPRKKYSWVIGRLDEANGSRSTICSQSSLVSPIDDFHANPLPFTPSAANESSTVAAVRQLRGSAMRGTTIVITGGLGALGSVVAETAAKRGASVALIDHAKDAPAGLAERLGAHALIVGGVDLTSPAAAETAMASVKAKSGRIDALLNIAGGFQWEMIADGKVDAWDRMYALNLKTALNACKAALPYLLENGAGRIVNVGAQSALHASSGFGPYAASKSAVHRLTESLADELKLKGVTVNAVLPSTIDTAVNRRDMPNADFSRWVAPADLAAIILFLASDEARAVTGALIPVSGRV